MKVVIEKNIEDGGHTFLIEDVSPTDVLELQIFTIDTTAAILNNYFNIEMGDFNHGDITKELNVSEINKNLLFLRNEIESKLNKINNDIDNLLK